MRFALFALSQLCRDTNDPLEVCCRQRSKNRQRMYSCLNLHWKRSTDRNMLKVIEELDDVWACVCVCPVAREISPVRLSRLFEGLQVYKCSTWVLFSFLHHNRLLHVWKQQPEVFIVSASTWFFILCVVVLVYTVIIVIWEDLKAIGHDTTYGNFRGCYVQYPGTCMMRMSKSQLGVSNDTFRTRVRPMN
jgi:hypothetical protein